MVEEILSPLERFPSYKEKFREIAEKTFEELTIFSKIDIESNRILCNDIKELKLEKKKITNLLGWWIACCALMWIVAIIWPIIYFSSDFQDDWIISTLCILGCILILVLLFWKIHPIIKKYKSIKNELEIQIKNKEQEAWDMMAPLNQLYDWNIFNRMITKTVPRLEFDPFFTKERLANLINNYEWDENFNENRSIIFSHSGLINGNPFIIARTRKMEWISKTYSGNLTVNWTEIEKDADGKTYTREHSETLYASINRPFPDYYEETQLIYGNAAAPDLTFTRETNITKLKVDSLAYNLALKNIKNISRNLDNDFAMSTNEEFEVLFTTTDRNNNQQFFLLFTPLAQENMINIIRDKEYGYGDDFQFIKDHKLNFITAEHMQDLPLDMNPSTFWNYDYDEAKEIFIKTTCENFRAIYFGFAPLFSIPLYQQLRSTSSIYNNTANSPLQSSYWEHESLANFWGEDNFADADCVTQNILKTTEKRKRDGIIELSIYAHGHRSEPRVDYVSVRCKNGNYYDVPVEWQEYFPVIGTGAIEMKEDIIEDDTNLDPITRLQKTNQKLNAFGENSIFRRHITSRIK